MAASRDDISRWFDAGKSKGATHMLVVCDTFDYDDYPVYVGPDEDVHEIVKAKTGGNMQQLMEVYSFKLGKNSQMAEHRARHYD